jgi:flagellar motor switch protein FliM
LNHLQEGDLLFFKKDETSLMTASGVPTFHVNVGTRGSQVAVQIDHEHIHGKI